MSRFNPFRARFRRVALLAVLLSTAPVAAQEVVVSVSMNTCWNACTRTASIIFNYYFLDVG